ncbi:MAG: TIGR00282 family metallophosphoesterase [Thermodesulfovibrio sp.]|jgi:metallophosphoesterase (TIGR00282 family)|uniref:TIGR00282 family metallophosphoesterase n=1 Tax=unclassified Thermodesulfovibrio TaxID=2645936 RepID=UPI00083AB886|nr:MULTISPECIES: TIGR00282 family metallophosphoesterase [unclassified Thermodesulfovibrio]MDI1471321.1 TIGR00282 family metallophosphoesterase [Thermodesulfovibrio sp. 1176]MDI6714661.1 TIGR00282 family metallophosphoesterase [Thermodesulfovibrio sp.]ODA43585.1 Phosphoesterase [Thermodesulfovibrio sp. N1]
MQNNEILKVLFIGDIVGKSGRQIIKTLLSKLIEKYNVELVIANGENAAGGFGLTEKVAEELFSYGIDIITTGNHVWDKKEVIPYIAKESRILRPINYPEGVPGIGSIVFKTRKNKLVGIINASGRIFMNTLDCPFRVTKKEVERIKNQTKLILIDFHAEATSEKIAFAMYLDGNVSAVIGTHTHVQTADEKILPQGTAYITDVGMTGPEYSVIGFREDEVIEKFLYQLPKKFEVSAKPSILSAVYLEIDSQSGKSLKIERLMIRQN